MGYPFMHTRIIGDRVTCRGTMRTTDTGADYRIEVVYKPWTTPKVHILDPAIQPERKLHFFDNGTLCLFDWREQPWQKHWNLADTIIPWTAEWLLYYELYLLTGKWLGRSALHDGAKRAEPKSDDRQTEQMRSE